MCCGAPGGRHRPGGGGDRSTRDRRGRGKGRRPRRHDAQPTIPPAPTASSRRSARSIRTPRRNRRQRAGRPADARPGRHRAALGPLADPAVDIATLAAEITKPDERTNPNVVKVVGSPIAPGRLRALYFTRATAPPATARSIITSGFTPIAAPRWSASSRCRPRRSSSARGWSSCARSRPACASTSRSSTACRSASTRRPTSRRRAPCCDKSQHRPAKPSISSAQD